MHRLMMLTVLAVLAPSSVLADGVVQSHVPNAQPVGTGRLSVLFWDVYDATLYAPNAVWNPAQPHALHIVYFREIEGGDIAERSADEMRKQGFADEAKLAEWQKKMAGIFPDVHKGSQLTAIYTAQKSTDFYEGDKRIGSIKDPEFSRRFFDIWLAETTSEPELRRKLLGGT